MKFNVYCTRGADIVEPQLVAPYQFRLWRPGPFRVFPRGLPASFGLWWASHYLRLFHNRDYAVLYVMDGNRIVHRTCMFPAGFRWPFMAKYDLQIACTWTDPAYRGKGIATAALNHAMQIARKPGRRFWYITRPQNRASIAVCTHSRFQLVGTSLRTRWLGVRMLGQFVMMDDVLDEPVRIKRVSNGDSQREAA